jgi:uncharacterized protein
MDYLITGASGFLGTKLVDVLLAAGHGVNYLGRKRSARLDSRAAYFCWQPGQAPPLETMPRLDVVVNLAGEPVAQRWSESAKRAIRDSRVLGTRNLVEGLGASEPRPRTLVSSSAIGYYGAHGEEPLDEDAPAGLDFLAEVCVEWERESSRAAALGMRVVQVRTGVVLDRGGGALAKMLTPFKLGLGGKVGSGRQYWSWVAIDDVIGAIHHALVTDSLSGPVNVVSPNPITNQEFTNTLGHVLKRPTIFPLPAFMARLLVGEMADDLLLASARVVPRKLDETGYQFRFRELEPAFLHLLGRPAQ